MNASSGEVLLDFDRQRRTGLDEAVFAQGKSIAQLELTFAAALSRNAALLVTRLTPEKHSLISSHWASFLDYCADSHTAFFNAGSCRVVGAPQVAIVAAGTSDSAVAHEAERTLAFNGMGSLLFLDVGVAGLWRLVSRIDAISEHRVVIAVAGMDAALPTVLGGLIAGLIIAVPTSVGYGVATGGHAALNAILSSCASGITVVNIDNGYGAACAALRALRPTARVTNPMGTVGPDRHGPATASHLKSVIGAIHGAS